LHSLAHHVSHGEVVALPSITDDVRARVMSMFMSRPDNPDDA
jgi:hypothetical protein